MVCGLTGEWKLFLSYTGGIYTADYIDAHAFSGNHKQTLLQDELCGCFYCLTSFHPSEITEWVTECSGTAICPYCGIDSIIGESSGYPITEAFLKQMKEYWF